MAGRWVHDEAGGLVDDEQVLVGVDDSKLDLLALERRLPRRLELDELTARKAVALGPSLPVDLHHPRGEQPLGGRARADLGQLGEEAVEPGSGCRARDATLEPLGKRGVVGAALDRHR